MLLWTFILGNYLELFLWRFCASFFLNFVVSLFPPYFLTSFYFLRIFLQLIAYYLFFHDFTSTSVIFWFLSIPFYFVDAFLYPSVFISEKSSIISWGHYQLVVFFFLLTAFAQFSSKLIFSIVLVLLFPMKYFVHMSGASHLFTHSLVFIFCKLW